VLSVVAFVLCVAAAAVGTAIASPGLGDTWSLSAGLLGQSALSLTLGVITGVAFGAALLSSAPAIVLSFVLPLGWAAIGSIHALEPTARWLDSTRSLAPLTEHLLSATEWARAGTTLALWLVLPLVIGMWRILRNEVA
jgi:ABC-2 type transport system permease protein